MDPQELQAVLAWSALPHVGERTLLALMDHAREGRQGLADLWLAAPEDLRRLVSLDARAVALLETEGEARWERAAEEARDITRRGVDVLVPSDAEYPAILAQSAHRRWPLVFAYGALGLFEEPRVAFANSRNASHAAIAITDAVADALARRDLALVTSTNREAYQAAATAAKRHAAPTVMVLDRGIAEAFPAGLEREPVATARVWDTAFDPELQLLLSPCGWRERWHPRSGPRRDGLLFTLADVVVAVDIREEGVMAAECREAARQGKTVVALDRGPETPEGVKKLWEEAPSVHRLTWGGGERTANEVLRYLPGGAPAEEGGRELSGWQREVGQFLARVCAILDREREGATRAPRVVEAYPLGGAFVRTVRQWSAREVTDGKGPAWLLADLVAGSHSAHRPAQLLERLRAGGILAALVPIAWLEQEGHARDRAAWLERAALRLVARVPGPVAGGTGPVAAVILQREGRPEGDAPVFSPDKDRMGRFYLRRYLQEILASLSTRPR